MYVLDTLQPLICLTIVLLLPLPALLQAAGLDQVLSTASDPNYSGPQLPEQQYVIDLPWWFAGAQTAAAPPPPPPPAAPQAPPPVGVPASGPYTVSVTLVKRRFVLLLDVRDCL
jgi:hypothetical protein